MTAAAGHPIAYLILAHGRAEGAAELSRLLASADPTGTVVVHFDLASDEDQWRALRLATQGCDRIRLVEARRHSAWGSFGIVAATLAGLRLLRDAPVAFDHVQLLSASCMPLRPLSDLRHHLAAAADTDFIEVRDARWIRDGLRTERYRHRFPFNYLSQHRRFGVAEAVQALLGVRRTPPCGLGIAFGSQWWCLSRRTCLAILDFLDARPEIERFFASTWIPDEMFFQSLAGRLAAPGVIADRSLTLYDFDANGVAVIFGDGDEARLAASRDHFFARKIDPAAGALRRRLSRRAHGEACPDQ